MTGHPVLAIEAIGEAETREAMVGRDTGSLSLSWNVMTAASPSHVPSSSLVPWTIRITP